MSSDNDICYYILYVLTQDVDIKRQGAASAYAFVQYADIVSVVKALRQMEGEHIGANKIKVSVGVMWCDLSDL